MSDTDYINEPPHYTQGGVQSIAYIKQQLGNNHRYKYKTNPLEDLKKSQWYLNRLIEELSNE